MKFGSRAAVARRLYQQWVPVAVLIVGGVLTGTAATMIAARQQTAAAETFRSDTLAIQRLTEVHLDTVVAVTRAAAALLAASPEINFAEFRAFVAGLQLRDRYAGVEGIGYAPLVSGSELRAFVRSVRLDGIDNLQVRPEGERAGYFPAVLVEPASPDNAAAVGFDLAAEPEQVAAMERARDTNAPAISPILRRNPLAGRRGRELVLYLPVYRRAAPLASVEQRRKALVGFVFTRLRPDTLFDDSVAAASIRLLDIAIYDGAVGNDTLLVSSGEPRRSERAEASILIGGRQWRVAASGRNRGGASLPAEAQRVVLGGALLSMLLFALMRLQARAWQTAERHAAELRAADRAKDEFLAVLSHELRTPLNAMLGWLSMLRGGSLRDDRRAHALDIVERNARAQKQLIDDLLEVSRILMGKMPLDKRPLSVVPAITTVVESLRPTADAKGVVLHGPDPAHTDTFVIDADVGRFAQIITNLVANGVKFTPAGGAVWVNVEAADGTVKIAVRDTGIGIAPEFLPFVFDRFRQADTSTTRSYSGLGMGLAIVRDLVRLHGGTIDAQSNGLNQGSVFIVSLPLLSGEGTAAGGTELVLAGT